MKPVKNGMRDFIQDYCNRRERLNSTPNLTWSSGGLQPGHRVKDRMENHPEEFDLKSGAEEEEPGRTPGVGMGFFVSSLNEELWD